MTHQVRSFGLALGAFAVGLMTLFGTPLPASASTVTLPYSQSFATPETNTAAFQAEYPEFTLSNADATVDSSGVLHLTDSVFFTPAKAWVTPILDLAGPEVINVDVTGSTTAGAYNVGIDLGVANTDTDYDRIVFHPGFSDGAFRISVGATDGTNTPMGWDPSGGDPQHVHLVIDPSGLVNITITDTADPSHVFTASFTNPLVYGADVGLYRSRDSSATGDAQFSNFSIVPEPGSLALLAIGGIMALRRRRA